MAIDQVRRLLQSRQFESFVGIEEDAWLEAKQKTAYDLGTPTGRYELAKDVCAFANSEGGFLLVGLITEPLIEKNTDRVASLDLCVCADFDSARYEGVIRDYVYPRLDGLSVVWIPSASQADLGLGVIEIPPQNAERKYFLTARIVEDNQSLRQIVFGLSRRNSSDNDPMSIQELHLMMQKGKSTTAQQLGRIEEKVDVLIARSIPTSPPTESAVQRLDRRTEEILDES